MNLLEKSGYISQPRTKFLVENTWAKRINAVESVNGQLPLEKKAAMAVCLENTQSFIKFLESNGTGATQSADIGQFKRFALDLVGAVVPNLIAFDLVSVQAISNRVGMVNFIKYSYGTSKGATDAGTSFGDVLNYGKSDVNYTSTVVDAEEKAKATAAAVTFSLDWANIKPGTVTINHGNVIIKDDGAGALKAASGLSADGTIDYASGECAYTLSAADTTNAPIVSYEYDNEIVPSFHLPSITLSIESLPVQAKARRLAALWGLEANFELQKEYGQSADDLLSSTAAGEIAHEIDIEICNDLYKYANYSTDINFSLAVPVGVSVHDHYNSFKVCLDKAANKVYQETRKVRPNWILCGTNVLTVIENCDAFKGSNATDLKGPYMAGTFSTYKVFVSPDLDPNAYVLGYKGDTLLDAGYVYAPYMPIVSTQAVQLEDMMSRKGWSTMYATRLVNRKMYIRGQIISK